MPIHVHDVLTHAMSETELSRVRTELLTSVNTHNHSSTSSTTESPASAFIPSLAMLLCRRIARCLYRRLQSGWITRCCLGCLHQQEAQRETLPCLLMCPQPLLAAGAGVLLRIIPT